MVLTNAGAGFGLALLMALWWFGPALAAVVATGVLLCHTPGSTPAALGRFLVVLALVARYIRAPVCCGALRLVVPRMIAAEVTAHPLLAVLGYSLGRYAALEQRVSAYRYLSHYPRTSRE